jgi:hypothetical protein
MSQLAPGARRIKTRGVAMDFLANSLDLPDRALPPTVTKRLLMDDSPVTIDVGISR